MSHDIEVFRASHATALVEAQHAPLPDLLDPRLVVLREPGSERARSYRLLRHRLLSAGDPRVVAITSARPREGKTTCALNLALAMAEDTLTRVLVLDANLLRPALAGVFACTPSASLVASIVQSIDVGPPYPVVSLSGLRLHVAPLREAMPVGARLDRTLLATVLKDLRDAYDYIVIDAASVLESGDVDVVGECADGVVLTLWAGRSRRADLVAAVAQLAPARVFGSILLEARGRDA